MAAHVLLVFVKAPRPGQVKRRLAAEIGDEEAARVYRALAERVLAQTAPVEREYERVVCFTPEEARAEVSRWLPAETLVAQEGADLGQRMQAALAAAFAGGATRAALIGSDVPGLSRTHVRQALAALERHPVVLGPALDGGYYLVALREPRPELFRGVAWGTSSVRATTLERAESLGLAVHLLPPLRDVDTAADLAAADPPFRAT